MLPRLRIQVFHRLLIQERLLQFIIHPEPLLDDRPRPRVAQFTCMNDRQFPFDTFAKSCTVYSLLFHSTATPRRSIALIPIGPPKKQEVTSQKQEAAASNSASCSCFLLLQTALMGIRTPVTGVKSPCPRPLDDEGGRSTEPRSIMPRFPTADK